MADPARTKVLLADRPGFSRTMLARLLVEAPGVSLVATVAEPDLIEPLVQETQPDLVIVDDRLLRDVRWNGRQLGARLIVIGIDDDPGFAARARLIGAEAWVCKDDAGAVLSLLLPHAGQPLRRRAPRAPGVPSPGPPARR